MVIRGQRDEPDDGFVIQNAIIRVGSGPHASYVKESGCIAIPGHPC